MVLLVLLPALAQTVFTTSNHRNLKSTLSRFGRVASISAYSNINTLTWVVPGEMGYGGDDKGGDPVAAYEDSWGLSSVEKQISAQDDLRCPLCGR